MIIWLPDRLDGQCVWVSADGQAGRCAALADVPSETPAAIIMPGQWARIYPLELPKLRGAERLQAAGFALEDKIAAGLDTQHLVLTAAGDRGAVISKSKMQSVLSAAADAGLQVSGVYVDYDAVLPGPAQKIDGRIVVPHSVTGGSDGYSVDDNFYESADSVEPADPAGLSLNSDAAINFATGSFAARNSGAFGAASLARAAGFLAVLGVSILGWQIMQARAAQGQADYLKTQTAAIFTQMTGQAAPPNPALRVTRALKSGGGNKTDFLSLSAILFSALDATPGAQIETLDYDAGRTQLRVRVLYPDLQTATQMERAAAGLGGTLTTGNLRERSGVMMGDAVLMSGGGQ